MSGRFQLPGGPVVPSVIGGDRALLDIVPSGGGLGMPPQSVSGVEISGVPGGEPPPKSTVGYLLLPAIAKADALSSSVLSVEKQNNSTILEGITGVGRASRALPFASIIPGVMNASSLYLAPPAILQPQPLLSPRTLIFESTNLSREMPEGLALPSIARRPSNRATTMLFEGIDLATSRYQGVSLFADRSVVLAASFSMLQVGEQQASAVINRILGERPSSFEVLRPHSSMTAAIQNTILLARDVIGAWNQEESNSPPASRESRGHVVGELRRILRIPGDHPIGITWKQATGEVAISDRANSSDPTELFSGNFSVVNGSPAALVSSRLPLRTLNIAPPTPIEVVHQLLQKISSADSANAELTLLFDGFGDERGLVVLGANRQSGQSGLLTPRMMAEALRSRAEHFAGEREQRAPLLVLSNRLSGTFDRRLGEECMRLRVAMPSTIFASEDRTVY